MGNNAGGGQQWNQAYDPTRHADWNNNPFYPNLSSVINYTEAPETTEQDPSLNQQSNQAQESQKIKVDDSTIYTEGLSAEQSAQIGRFVQQIYLKGRVSEPELGMHTYTETKSRLDDIGLKVVEFDEKTKQTKDKLNEGISTYDKVMSAPTPIHGAVIATQHLFGWMENVFRGNKKFTNKLYIESNAEVIRDFLNAVDVITPYYETGLVYATSKGLPPQVVSDIVRTLYNSYAGARGIADPAFGDLIDRFVRDKLYDSKLDLTSDYYSLKHLIKIDPKDPDAWRLEQTNTMNKLKETSKYSHSKLVDKMVEDAKEYQSSGILGKSMQNIHSVFQYLRDTIMQDSVTGHIQLPSPLQRTIQALSTLSPDQRMQQVLSSIKGIDPGAAQWMVDSNLDYVWLDSRLMSTTGKVNSSVRSEYWRQVGSLMNTIVAEGTWVMQQLGSIDKDKVPGAGDSIVGYSPEFLKEVLGKYAVGFFKYVYDLNQDMSGYLLRELLKVVKMAGSVVADWGKMALEYGIDYLMYNDDPWYVKTATAAVYSLIATYALSAGYHYTVGMVLTPGNKAAGALLFTAFQIGTALLYGVKKGVPLPKLLGMIGSMIKAATTKKATFEDVLGFVDQVLDESALESQAAKREDMHGVLAARIRVFELTLVKAHEYGFDQRIQDQIEKQLAQIKEDIKKYKPQVGTDFDMRQQRFTQAFADMKRNADAYKEKKGRIDDLFKRLQAPKSEESYMLARRNRRDIMDKERVERLLERSKKTYLQLRQRQQ